MNIRAYLFRLTISGMTFVLGLSAQHNLQQLDRSCRHWFNAAAAVINKFVPIKREFEKFVGGAKAGHAASYNLTGEYYLSEEVVPIEFTDFARIEFTTYNYSRGTPVLPTGAIYTDRKYKFTNIAMHGDQLNFETEEKGGVSYRFKGKVVQLDEQEEQLPECGVGDLVGRLEMLKNGSTWATIDTTFFLFGN